MNLRSEAAWLVVGAFLMGPVACGKDSSAAPVDSGIADASAGDGGASAPVRTIETRNPFGHTSETENLFADGDFEFTGPSEQPPWHVLGLEGELDLRYDTGARCASGIRCARLAAGSELLGWLATPKSGSIAVSVVAKPASGVCSDVSMRLFDTNDTSRSFDILLASPIPDERGFCHFVGETPNFAGGAPVLFVAIDPSAKGDVLVDDAVALAKGTSSGNARAPDPISSAMANRLARAAAYLRARRFSHLPARVHGSR
ncbi:hypothetical protein [Labilithrix luteola]|nr:hypothetical protein [Labilithrix luteola]